MRTSWTDEAVRLDRLSQDVYGLLQKHEPNTLLWREIVEELWLKYRFEYMNMKNFGVGVSQKLKQLRDKHRLVVKRGNEWGTLRANWRKEVGGPTTPLGDRIFWRRQALEDLSGLRNMIVSGRDDIIVQAPEATLLYMRTLPEKMKENLKPEITDLENQIARTNKRSNANMLRSIEVRRLRMIAIAFERLPGILEKISKLLYEIEG